MSNCIRIPSTLEGFINTETELRKTVSGREMYLLNGKLADTERKSCPKCGCKMHIHDVYEVNLRHLCLGKRLTAVRFDKNRYICPCCGESSMQEVPF